MRNTKKILRKAVYDLLTGGSAISVPVFDEKKKVGSTVSKYVVLSTQQETQDNTDESFITNSSIDIEIIVKSGFEATKDMQDDIEEEILEKLIPSQSQDILTANGFLIHNFTRERSITRNISLSETESVLQTIITFTSIITQQQ